MKASDDTALMLTCRIKTSPARVFRAWTDPVALRQWFAASEQHECVLAETDVRVGGRYRLVMRLPSGEERAVGGVYREIVPDHRLVFTWSWEGASDAETLVSVELRQEDGGTALTLTHQRFADTHARDMHRQGWSGCLAGLERLMARDSTEEDDHGQV